MASTISLVALSLDTMLPALPEIGRDLGLRNSNDAQMVISSLVFGLSFGQIIYGPLSDSMGRKPMLFAGVAIFVAGCALSLLSTSFTVMLAGRVLQGVGSAGPRSMVVAMIRDQYEGRAMARVMSSIMAVFIVVPAIAPTLGQGIILLAGWRAIFGTLLTLSLINVAWFALRQPETLLPRHRIPFSVKRISGAVVEVCRNRTAFGYTVVAGFILGAFLGYLNSAQQIFQELYGLGTRFPLFFGILALSIGSASLFNSRIVMRFGMRRLTAGAMKLLTVLSGCHFTAAYAFGGHSPLWMLMACFMVTFFCIGVLFGNLNAIAMSPMGHIAGTASAVIGALSGFISVPIAIWIGKAYNGTTLPLIGGFTILGILSLFVMRWAENALNRGSSPIRLKKRDHE
ncbi:MAG: multidrug effflux MFS transporter [Desulfobacterales bacterium]